MIQWRNEQRRLRDLIPWERNPRQIKRNQAKRLIDSFNSFGQVEMIAIGPNNEVYNGHQRLQVLMQTYGPDYEVSVRVASRPLDEKEREKLVVYLHRGAVGEWDFDLLANEFDLEDLLEWGFEEKDFGIVRESEFAGNNEQDSLGIFSLKTDVVFPSNLTFNIPPLREDLLLEIPDDVQVWPGDDLADKAAPSDNRIVLLGYTMRKMSSDQAILAFYVDDYRFESLWSEPDRYVMKFLNAGIRKAISPNFSLWTDDPQAMRIWNTYRSRWLGRYMQEAGMRILPDVNWALESDFGYCFAGIPSGCDVSVQMNTIRAKNKEEVSNFIAGITEFVKQCRPSRILFYGGVHKRKMIEAANLNVPYVLTESAVALRRPAMERKSKMKENLFDYGEGGSGGGRGIRSVIRRAARAVRRVVRRVAGAVRRRRRA
jgi:hypothetical protein